MKFIYVFNENLKDSLLNKGFKLVKHTTNGYAFLNDQKQKFNFEKYSPQDYILSNKLTF